MKEKWTFNGLELTENTRWGVEQVIEGIGLPNLRGNNTQVPFRHGKRWQKKKFDSRAIIFSMWMRANDKQELDENIDTFLKTVGVPGTHLLKRTLRDGSTREAQAEINAEIDFVRKTPSYTKFALELDLIDPFFYGNKSTETIEIDVTTKTLEHINQGTTQTDKLIITLIGPLESPKIENLPNGIWLQYQSVINEGDTITINTEDFTCYKGTDNMISAIKHGGDISWMVLESGINNLKITSSSAGGSLKFEYYPVYF